MCHAAHTVRQWLCPQPHACGVMGHGSAQTFKLILSRHRRCVVGGQCHKVINSGASISCEPLNSTHTPSISFTSAQQLRRQHKHVTTMPHQLLSARRPSSSTCTSAEHAASRAEGDPSSRGSHIVSEVRMVGASALRASAACRTTHASSNPPIPDRSHCITPFRWGRIS